MTTPIRWGEEFLVNTITYLQQYQPTITALADGRFVVVWTDGSGTGIDASATAVRAQIFNADGSPSGAEFLVNASTRADQSEPTVTALADGRFVVAWTDPSGTGGDMSGSAIRAQVFNADGSPSGAELQVNATMTNNQHDPSIIGLADGRFVVAWNDWSSLGANTSSADIRAQIFNADGSPSGAEFLVNTPIDGWQSEPAIAALADGRFVVTWTDQSYSVGDTFGAAVRAQVYNADGSPLGGSILVNTTTAANQFQPTITALVDGRFVVAWRDESATGGDTSGSAIRAQVFHADGRPSGAEFLVNTTTAANQSQPVVTALPDGRFVVAWTDASATGGDTSGAAVRAQVLNADGSPSGAEFLVNTTTGSFQFQPTITALADGRFTVAWRDDSGTGGDVSSTAVRGQIFDPRMAAVQLNGTLADDDFVGTLFGDRMSGSFGHDKLSGATGDDWLWGEDGHDRLWGGSGNDRLDGGEADDQLWGEAGSDLLNGGAGHDTLDGGVGADRLEGGMGDDIYILADDGDVVVEGVSAGTDEVRAGVSHALGANVENLLLTGTSALSGTGNELANRLTGNSAANLLSALDGNDTLLGLDDIDTLLGGGGNDTLVGGSGSDTLTGGAGNDAFQFNSRLELGDVIADFSNAKGNDDRFLISASEFGGGLVGGQALAARQFQTRADNLAQDSNDRFIFRTTDKTLWFDEDGKGGVGPVMVADLQANATVTSADLWLM